MTVHVVDSLVSKFNQKGGKCNGQNFQEVKKSIFILLAYIYIYMETISARF